MSRAEFEVAYDGGALRSHTMDVEHLAPALIAMGDLCREANRVLNGDRASVSVLVKADFERACFSIHFQLVQSIYSQIKDLVSEDHVETAKTVLEWLGLLGVPTGVISLIGYRKWKKGRFIENETRIVNKDGSVQYVIKVTGDSNTISIPAPVRELANDPGVAKAEQAVMRPLLIRGIDTLEVREAGKIIEKVSSDQAHYFELVEEEPPIGMEPEPQVIRTILQLRSPVFVEGEKWQFHFGEQKISATIEDTRFLERVYRFDERFGFGDKFKVDLEVRQYETKTGTIRNAYVISKVLEVWHAKRQPSLPLDPQNE